MKQRLTVEDAIRAIEDTIQPVETETVPATESHSRILREDVLSPMDQPPWPRSPLDGYAFRAADSKGATKETPVCLEVVDTIYAGEFPRHLPKAGQAVRLMTGAPIPDTCDCVLRQEDTDLGREQVKIFKELSPYDNYCHVGENYRKGDRLIPAGTLLDATALGLLASCGLLREDVPLTVSKPIRCSLFCTGDELETDMHHPLPPGKIWSSNGAFLSARLKELGVEITRMEESFPDDSTALAKALEQAEEEADFILTVGAVSVGEKDILPETIRILGARKVFHGVDIKPGAYLMFSMNRKPILSLSGNPFAAGITFEVFGRPLIGGLMGCKKILPLPVQGVLEEDYPKGSDIPRYVRGVFQNGGFTLLRGHSSGKMTSDLGTNCLVEIPPQKGPLPKGSKVKGWLL